MKMSVNDFLQALSEIGLAPIEIDLLSREVEFTQRKGGKIDVGSFLAVLFRESVCCAPSFNDLAVKLDTDAKIFVSKQAIAQRIDTSCLNLLKAILAKVLLGKFAQDKKQAYYSCSTFKRILVQDSTIVRLPQRLFEKFSGVRNAHGIACNARIQAVYDLIAEEFTYFSIDTYSKNDITAAPDLEILKGDFTLRDRGYTSYAEIERHLEVGAHTIYRHKQNHTYLNPDTEEEIDLLKTLQKNGHIDMEVLLNNDSKKRIRLVAAPVSEENANTRRMKSKKESGAKTPSATLLKLMSWSIYITTVLDPTITFQKIFDMYALRWRIETIFKSWKSCLNFSKLHNVSEIQLRVIITARLTAISIIHRFIYAPAYQRILQCYDRRLSLIKLTRYLTENKNITAEIICVLLKTNGQQPLLNSLARYCTYDKRKRLNFCEKMDLVFESWSLA
jgi:hypothetical protein